MQTFAELRKKLKLKPGEKEVSKQGNKNGEVLITKQGNKFNLYLDGELAEKGIKSEKEAKKMESLEIQILEKLQIDNPY